MSLPANITISQAANMIAAWIDVQVAQWGGKTYVAANIRHLWEYVLDMGQADTPRAIICYTGEEARGGFDERNTLCRVDRQWVMAVMRGHGFKNDTVQQVPPIELPFTDALETLRERLRRLRSVSEEELDYKAIRALPGVAQQGSANVFLDGFMIEFSTANNIPQITTVAPGTDG